MPAAQQAGTVMYYCSVLLQCNTLSFPTYSDKIYNKTSNPEQTQDLNIRDNLEQQRVKRKILEDVVECELLVTFNFNGAY